jgi:valyl-tRNA synthetase
MLGLRVYLRLLAPFLPFVVEEVWSWRFAAAYNQRSIHGAQWPNLDELSAVPEREIRGTYGAAIEVLTKIRGTKTAASRSLRWPVARLQVIGPEAQRAALEPVLEDVLRAGNVTSENVELIDGPSPELERFTVTVELAETMED